MTAILETKQLFTLEEYLRMEEHATEKHTFENGKIKIMPGGTANHNEISANAITALSNAVRQLALKFRVFSSDMKIRIPYNNKVLYPDALVIAENPEFYEARKDIITNPLLIVEVISPSSEAGDRGSKFHDYRTITTFKEYLLLWQDEAFATLATRQSNDLWRMTDIQGLDQHIQLESIGCTINMADLYFNIEF
jgi:Uma2 family endonuclease